MPRPPDPTTRLLLACGAIGPALFVIVALVEGATRPGYSAWRNYVSDLSLSGYGWMQVANFLACGLLTVLFAVGLRRALRGGPGAAAGPLLLAVFGLALIVAGIFTDDPGRGYPPGVPAAQQTAHGTIHGVAGLIAFGTLAAAAFVLGRRLGPGLLSGRWAAYSTLTGALVAVMFVLSIATDPLRASGVLPWAVAGLLQRLAIVAGWSWLVVLALRVSGAWGRRGAANGQELPARPPAGAGPDRPSA